MDNDVLDEAYERLRRAGPEFGGDEEGRNSLSNHGPMAVEVLARRGHGAEVPRWLDAYERRLDEMPSQRSPVTDEDWPDALGDGRRIGDWTAYFERQMAERPWREVLLTWWPRLLPGIAAGATHGLIRTGHAVRALAGGDESPSATAELARGLAYWAGRSQAVPGACAPAGRLDASAALDGLPHLPDQSGVIASRLPRLAGLPGWPASTAALRRPADDSDARVLLAELIDAATLRYLSHAYGSPVLLVHTATAPNAVLHVLPVLPPELWGPSLSAVWSASAALIAAYEPAAPEPRDQLPVVDPDADIADTVARAADHGDEHVIKFTDTAVEVYERTGDPDALAACARSMQLMEPSRPA